MFGKGSNRINELHDSNCPRVSELARIIDIFVNGLEAKESCLKRRAIVKIALELLRLTYIVQKETLRRMKVVDENVN